MDLTFEWSMPGKLKRIGDPFSIHVERPGSEDQLALHIIPVEYFYGDGSPLFLSQRQMTSTPQNLIKNIIFMPQFLPGDVIMAPGNIKLAPGDVEL